MEAVAQLHVRADQDPSRDNVLAAGELITHLEIPVTDLAHAMGWPDEPERAVASRVVQ